MAHRSGGLQYEELHAEHGRPDSDRSGRPISGRRRGGADNKDFVIYELGAIGSS